jgi:hypothetical protein
MSIKGDWDQSLFVFSLEKFIKKFSFVYNRIGKHLFF